MIYALIFGWFVAACMALAMVDGRQNRRQI
jgi:hypothetical protein